MSEVVKYKSVTVTVYPWTHESGREYWRFKKQGKAVTRSTLEAAKREALAYARATYRGELSISDLTPSQASLAKRFLDLNPSMADLEAFISWRRKYRPTVTLEAARTAFLSSKATTAGHYHGRNLGRYLSVLDPLKNRIMRDITPSDLRALFDPSHAPRTLSNIRQVWVTFWRWAAKNEMIDKESSDLPTILDLPSVVRGIPEIYSAADLRILLGAVKPAYLPWLALSAFGGIRQEEIAPAKGNTIKAALDWSDFHWDRDLFIVRPETSKTGRRRVIPILPVLGAWLKPIARPSGRMAPKLPPSAGSGKQVPETTRLGRLLDGGWKRNALRHSFITYRAALVGISQTAMEAGNSESEARRSYVDAQGPDAAAEWFSVFPS